MSRKIFTLVIAGACMVFKSQAQADSSHPSELNEIVVTATKFPLKQSLTGKILTVISRDDLERSAGKSLPELLNTQAGLIISGSSGTPGTVADIYFQGAAAGKTLILLDGIPAYDPSGTRPTFDLNLVNTDQVERIEILKGSQSTLYGSDAVAGVINIITRKAGAKPLQAGVNLSAGSYGSINGSAFLSGKTGTTTYFVQADALRSDGISSAYDPSNSHTYDRDGFRKISLVAKAEQRFSDRFSMRASIQHTEDSAALDEMAYTDDKNYGTASNQSMMVLGGDYIFGKGVLHVNYSYNFVRRTYLDDSSGENRNYSNGSYKGYSHFAEAYTNMAVTPKLDWLIGADYRYQATTQHYVFIDPTYGAFPSLPISNDTAFVKQFAGYSSLVLKDADGFNMEVGLRYNHFNKYGDVFTWSANPSFLLNNELKFFANYSSGFSAPTLYQLYSEYKNPNGDLKPEKSTVFEAGLQYSKNNFSARALWFNRIIRNVIIFYTSPSYENYYINQDRQDDHGAELELHYNPGKYVFSANYSFVTGHVTTQVNGKDTLYNNLYRRPKNTFNFSAGWHPHTKIFTSISLQSIGKRTEYVYGAAPTFSSAYYTLNLYSDYAFSKKMKVFADLKNITDQKYFEIPGYNSKGFNFMSGIHLLF